MSQSTTGNDPPRGPESSGKPKDPAPSGPVFPRIADQDLIRCIGRGSYGEVWLSRSVTGCYRAVKVVYRNRFEHDQPFEREFSGLRHFEKVCLDHPGLVALLQVGINQQAGYFYYVMELADDLKSGSPMEPENYRPKTLRSLMYQEGRIPLERCFEIGVKLADALKHLQEHQLIHRDVKPSNVIFVNGAPKFADIGLVTPMNEPASWVGTDPYIPPEGPGGPTSDLYALGRVLYEISTGFSQDRFPELPTDLLEGPEAAILLQLNRIILRACALEKKRRYASAEAMRMDLLQRGTVKTWRLSVLCLPKVQPDSVLLEFLGFQLPQHGFQVFVDSHRSDGVQGVREVEKAISQSDAVVALLSAASVLNEMVVYELELADEAARTQSGLPRILPVRVQYDDPLPEPLARIMQDRPQLVWRGPQDNQLLLADIIHGLSTPEDPPLKPKLPIWESTGGAVPLDSKFYVERPADEQFKQAIRRKDSIVLVKGARQIGKTSLLARGIQHARDFGSRVVLTDFQKLDANHLASVEAFFLKLGDFLADQLDLDVLPADAWDERRSPNTNFERYLRREVLGKLSGHLVWGMDEVDRLFGRNFAGEVFGLLRSWHNERALDPGGPWARLTLVIAYATEAHLFINDINQSPFNVGTRLRLDDFTLEEVTDLNNRYGHPLQSKSEIQEFYDLLGGQPYLVRQALNDLAAGRIRFAEFAEQAAWDEGLFGDHLRRILVLLAKDADLCEIVRTILQGRSCRNATSFYRLRSAGVMKGDFPELIQPRCKVYDTYLKRHLLGSDS